MSSVLGSKTADGYLQLSSLGALSIELTPKIDANGVFNLDVGAENRMEVLHMETQPGETVDQFCQRLKGMLRALWQGERMPTKVDEAQEAPRSGKQKVDARAGKK